MGSGWDPVNSIPTLSQPGPFQTFALYSTVYWQALYQCPIPQTWPRCEHCPLPILFVWPSLEPRLLVLTSLVKAYSWSKATTNNTPNIEPPQKLLDWLEMRNLEICICICILQKQLLCICCPPMSSFLRPCSKTGGPVVLILSGSLRQQKSAEATLLTWRQESFTRRQSKSVAIKRFLI